jgi:hypothetical protein
MTDGPPRERDDMAWSEDNSRSRRQFRQSCRNARRADQTFKEEIELPRCIVEFNGEPERGTHGIAAS